jgi:hypothetical protein
MANCIFCSMPERTPSSLVKTIYWLKDQTIATVSDYCLKTQLLRGLSKHTYANLFSTCNKRIISGQLLLLSQYCKGYFIVYELRIFVFLLSYSSSVKIPLFFKSYNFSSSEDTSVLKFCCPATIELANSIACFFI